MHIEPDEQEDLGNATRIYILGSITLFISFFTLILYFIGIFICLGTGLLTLLLSSHDLQYYEDYKAQFTQSSYEQVRIGRRNAIIGLVITGIWLIIWAVNYGKDGLN